MGIPAAQLCQMGCFCTHVALICMASLRTCVCHLASPLCALSVSTWTPGSCKYSIFILECYLGWAAFSFWQRRLHFFILSSSKDHEFPFGGTICIANHRDSGKESQDITGLDSANSLKGVIVSLQIVLVLSVPITVFHRECHWPFGCSLFLLPI